MSFDLEQTMGTARALVDARLAALSTGGPPALLDAMRYALLGGGKRLRPILCLWTHDMLQGDEPEAALDTACAIECVHAYSLVHDDLPCMDDDELRRGRPTVHIQFGEAVAVLCGDALLNLAYETVLGAPWRDATRAVPVARALADAASHRGLLGGQMLDLESEGTPPSEARLHAIHNAKTGALIRAALVCGGLAAGAGADDLARLGRTGDALGLAFQITDDVLDVTAAVDAIGKSPGKDAGAGKVTFPAVYGVERSRDLARAQVEIARRELAAWRENAPLQALAAFCVERTS